MTNASTVANQQEVAAEILRQLGGNKFIAMTGSKNIMSTESGIRMNLQPNKSRATHLFIALCADDTYTMTFKKVNKKTFDVTTIHEVEGVYFDAMKIIFTQVTGFYTSL